MAPGLAALAALILMPVSSGPRVALVVTAGAFMLIGLIEDLRGVPTIVRLGLQCAMGLIGALLLAPAQPRIAQGAFILVGAIWLVSFVNAFNFMDGINGLSVAQASAAGITWSVVGTISHVPFLVLSSSIIVAAAIGFGPFNFPKAKVFLGDAGSYLFGAWLAVVAIVGINAELTPESILAPLSLYLADTSWTLIRRAVEGKNWFSAHREHVYQRLVTGGWSHAKTTIFIAGLLVICSILGTLSLQESSFSRVAIDLALALVVVGYLASPHLLQGKATRRQAASEQQS